MSWRKGRRGEGREEREGKWTEQTDAEIDYYVVYRKN